MPKENSHTPFEYIKGVWELAREAMAELPADIAYLLEGRNPARARQKLYKHQDEVVDEVTSRLSGGKTLNELIEEAQERLEDNRPFIDRTWNPPSV